MRRSTKSGPDLVPDFDLWDEIRRTAVPIHPRTKPTAAAKQRREARATVAPAPNVPARIAPAPRPRSPPAAVARYELTGLDRRTAQKLTRGKLAIDATVDLHGFGVEGARHRLLRFLENARADGHRTIRVITGKGASPYASSTLHGRTYFDAPERQGRLRRLLAHWLEDAEFRQHVTGFQPAHPRHGGGGAFYVRLRRHLRRDR
ncbi:MAG: Smr/MutS family protein [Pseudomonadota bacterium]|nr:Smr/MutS family protein [Pseudomonadota bacterium]